MPYSIHRQGDSLLLEIEGSLTIRHAREFWEELVEICEDCESVEIHTARLADVDTCVLQLLCSLEKSVTHCLYPDPSREFLEAVDRCGLRRHFTLMNDVRHRKEENRT